MPPSVPDVINQANLNHQTFSWLQGVQKFTRNLSETNGVFPVAGISSTSRIMGERVNHQQPNGAQLSDGWSPVTIVKNRPKRFTCWILHWSVSGAISDRCRFGTFSNNTDTSFRKKLCIMLMHNMLLFCLLMIQVLTLSTTCPGFKTLTLTLPSTPRKRRFSNSNFHHIPTKKKHMSQNQHSTFKKTQIFQPHHKNSTHLFPKKKHRELTPTSNFPFVSSRCAAFSRPVSCAALRMDRSWESAASLPPRRNVVPGRLFRDVDSTTVWWEQRSADLEKTTTFHEK